MQVNLTTGADSKPVTRTPTALLSKTMKPSPACTGDHAKVTTNKCVRCDGKGRFYQI